MTVSAVYAAAVVVGIIGLLFGVRALAVLRRPPTGEAGRELIFLAARDLLPTVTLLLGVVFIGWLGWLLQSAIAMDMAPTNEPDSLVDPRYYPSYIALIQGLLILVAGLMAYRVLVPYTRSRRTHRAQVTLSRLAARVTLLRGRR